MIDILKLQDSFLLKWADKLFDPTNLSWKDLAFLSFEKIGGISAFMSNLVSNEFKGLNLIDSLFWRKVLVTWLNYNNSENDEVKSVPSINDPIFNNRCITYKNQILFNARCIKLNVIYIKDFLMEGDIIAFNDFNNIFKNSADSLLIFNTLYNALIQYETDFKNEFDISLNDFPTPFKFRDLEAGKIDRKIFYEELRGNEIEPLKQVWLNLFHLNNEVNDFWCVSRETSSETKIIELQWKILQNIYPSGVLLCKMKIKMNDICDFCGEIDTIDHFFITCHVAKSVWDEVDKLISIKCGRRVTLSIRDKILGILDCVDFEKTRVRWINNLILVAKRTISKFKYDRVGNINILFENQLSFRGLLDQQDTS